MSDLVREPPAATRRNVLFAMASLAAALASSTAARGVTPKTASGTGRLMRINGYNLWVDDSGPRDAPAILYVHGGPGVGALEFETYMKPVLAGRARLISVDQRGVLRSDPLAKDATMLAADVVTDFEAIRRALGIERWQVVGHSFGGHFAMRYALRFPQHVTRLTLENPAYDVASAFHWLCASAAQLLNGVKIEAALEADRLAQHATPLDDAFIKSVDKTMAALGEHRQDLYVVQKQNRDMFSRLAKSAGLPDRRWEQGQIPGMALLHAADFRQPMLPEVAKIKVPMLLVRGSGDHATSPEEISTLLAAGARMATVSNAGHFIHVEEPAALARLLLS